MSASIAFDFSSVVDTVPNHFAFIDIEAYDNESYPDPTLRDMIFGLGAEGYRIIAHITDPGTAASPDGSWMNRVNVIKYLSDRAQSEQGRTVGVGFGAFAGPATLGAHVDPRTATDFDTTGSRSPQAAKDWLDYFKNTLGLTVEWMEHINEPGTQAAFWYSNGPPSGYADSAAAAQDWCDTHVRDWWAPINAAPSLHGSTRLNIMSNTPYDGDIQKAVIGQGFISASELTDANMLHADGYSDHAGYCSSKLRNTSDTAHRQSLLNAMVDPTWRDGNSTIGAGYLGNMLRDRFWMDTNGFTAKTMDDSEWQPDGGWTYPEAINWMAGVAQTAQYIKALEYRSQLKLMSKVLMSGALDDHEFATPPSYGGGLIIGHQGASPGFALTGGEYSVRAYNLIQQVHPFVRGYKNLVGVTITSNPLSPAGASSNSTDSIHCVAGLDGSGNGAILIANIDLTNAQTVTLNLGRTPTGSVTRVRMLQTDTLGTPLGSSTIGPASSFNITLNPGEVSYLTLPGVAGATVSQTLSASIGGAASIRRGAVVRKTAAQGQSASTSLLPNIGGSILKTLTAVASTTPVMWFRRHLKMVPTTFR